MTNQIRNPKSEIRPAATARQRGERKPENRDPNATLGGSGIIRASEFGVISDFEFQVSDFKFHSSFVKSADLGFPGNAHQKRAVQSGFTLMELMIVLVLIGIMAAMIVPEMKGSFEDAVLRSSARKLVDVFSLAYSRAVSFNQLHRVRLDTSTGHYLVECQAGGSQDPNDFVPATDMSGFEGQIDGRIGIEIRASQENLTQESDDIAGDQLAEAPVKGGITFYPDGTADGCEVLLRDRMGFHLALQINPSTARVHVLEQEGP
jgi:type II secretion system protein H